MQLVRYHGLGNDYLLLETGEDLSPGVVRALCDRHVGVGGDGILEPSTADGAEYGVVIWNSDGSVAEKSGNGLRIFAHWLVADNGAAQGVTISTGSEVVTCEVNGDHVEVDMGQATFVPQQVPVNTQAPLIDALVEVGGRSLQICAVGLGNPHCVVFCEEPEGLPWREVGALLEVHSLFPNRTNVQFARVLGSNKVEACIWERGVGETQASGSSACAIAAAAVETGRCRVGRVTVVMPGGELEVRVGEQREVILAGPVERIARVVVDEHWLKRRMNY